MTLFVIFLVGAVISVAITVVYVAHEIRRDNLDAFNREMWGAIDHDDLIRRQEPSKGELS